MRQQPFRGIAKELLRRVRTGVYPLESALPPRQELAREFGVARATLDRAVQELIRKRVLLGRHGSGTFVCSSGKPRGRIAVIGAVEAEECSGDSFDFEFTPIPASGLSEKSAWKRLFEFDGVLWVRPEKTLFPVIEAVGNQLPQILVNRVRPGIAYVSTDHRGAYYAMARERLALLPGCRVYFLYNESRSLPVDYRFDGFADACREAGRFYDLLRMPASFDGRLAVLRERLELTPGRPVLVMSDCLAQTGALMRFAAERNVRWREDMFYSDFDNSFGRDVWGVRVTSFIQNHPVLFREALAKLGRMLDGTEDPETGVLIAPFRRDGDT